MSYTKNNVEHLKNAEAKLPLRKLLVFLSLFILLPISLAARSSELEHKLRQHINQEIDRFNQHLGVKDHRRNIELFLPRGIEKIAVCDNLQISRRQPSEPPWGRISYSLSCQGSSNWQSRATARINIWLDLVVAQRTLEREEVLTADMLAIKTYEVSQINHGLEFNPEHLIGMKIRRRINAGQPVARHLLQNAYLVSSGSQVTIRISQDGFQASTRGNALSDGQLGERVKIQNLSSGKVIEGIVVGENLVEADSKRN